MGAKLALVLLAAGLASALLGVYMVASASASSTPRYVEGVAALEAAARLSVKPVALLGYRSVLSLSGPNSTVKAPVTVVRNATVTASLLVRGPVTPAGPLRAELFVYVYGFPVKVKEATGGTSVELNFTLDELRDAARRAAEEAGLPRPSTLKAEVVIEAPVRLDVQSPTGRGKALATIELREQGRILEASLKSQPARLRAPVRAERGSGSLAGGLALLAAGVAGLVGGGVLYASSRPRAGPEARAVPAMLPPHLPRVMLPEPEEVARIAEKMESPLLRQGNMLCTIDRGIAYCAPVSGSGAGAAASGGGGGSN